MTIGRIERTRTLVTLNQRRLVKFNLFFSTNLLNILCLANNSFICVCRDRILPSNRVSRQITAIFKKMLFPTAFNWPHVTNEQRDLYFNEFKVQ